jgi:hypothetical protein
MIQIRYNLVIRIRGSCLAQMVERGAMQCKLAGARASAPKLHAQLTYTYRINTHTYRICTYPINARALAGAAAASTHEGRPLNPEDFRGRLWARLPVA